MKTCIVHPDRPATKDMNVPCAPGGKIPVCDECAKPESVGRVFSAYKDSHAKRITAFKQTNPGS